MTRRSTNVHMPDDVYEGLRDYAHLHRLSQSAVVVAALRHYLKSYFASRVEREMAND